MENNVDATPAGFICQTVNWNDSRSSDSQIYSLLEIVCVFFWFLLDGFWLMEWKFLTYLFSALAIATAIPMFWFIKRDRVVVLVACADFCWLVLNVLWAVGDISKIDPAITAAKWLFLLGGLFCFAAFFCSDSHRRVHTLALSRLRVLKYFQRPPADSTTAAYGNAARKNI